MRTITSVRELVRFLSDAYANFSMRIPRANVPDMLRMLVDVWRGTDPIQWRIEGPVRVNEGLSSSENPQFEMFDAVAAARVGSEGSPPGVQRLGSGDDDLVLGARFGFVVGRTSYENAARIALRRNPEVRLVPVSVLRQVAAVHDAFPDGLGRGREPYLILGFAYSPGPVTEEERAQALAAVDRALRQPEYAHDSGSPKNKKAALRKRNHARDRRTLVSNIPASLCRGFPQTLVKVMEDSLQGDPLTIFVPDGSNENTGARGFRYFTAKSTNADWGQDLPEKIDRKELRYAMQRVATCQPLRENKIEHRWLVAFIKHAREHGWCASFDGRESPLCVAPEPPMRRAKLGPKHKRVWLALPELDYVRLLLDSRALHESPNLFVQGILRERWHDVDERAGIQDEAPARPAPAKPKRVADNIPF